MISVTLTDADIASAQPLDVLSTTVRTKFKVTYDQNTLKLEKMNSTSVEDALVHFTQHLESMKDWPDKAIIMELTGITVCKPQHLLVRPLHDLPRTTFLFEQFQRRTKHSRIALFQPLARITQSAQRRTPEQPPQGHCHV